MSELAITIKNGQNEVKKQITGQEEPMMIYEGAYEPGDTVTFETSGTNTCYVTRMDDTMDGTYVYLTNPSVEYVIPFDEKKISYNPKSFTGERHYITMRDTSGYENESYRNLAKDVMDQHGDSGCYPHTYANMETGGESVLMARNTIDGIVANRSHGAWPYESWGTNMQDDAEMMLDFGRPVDPNTVALYTRADFPHDNWWVKATFTFSDGSSQVVEMERSVKPHSFRIGKKGITWIKLSQLIKANDPSPFLASGQTEVYRKDAR